MSRDGTVKHVLARKITQYSVIGGPTDLIRNRVVHELCREMAP